MQTCPSCRTPIISSSMVVRFCPMCGTPIPEPEREPEPEPFRIPEDREIIRGEVLGWRAWEVRQLGKLVRLGSVTANFHWPARQWVTADCDGHDFCHNSSDGRVPGEGCHCGIYSARTFEHLTRDMGYARHPGRVVGQIALAGKVIQGSQGFKAERARIVRIYVPQTEWKLGRKIAAQYGIDYETLRWRQR